MLDYSFAHKPILLLFLFALFQSNCVCVCVRERERAYITGPIRKENWHTLIKIMLLTVIS